MAENVRVICRIRPLNLEEISGQKGICLTCLSPTTVSIGTRVYTYDAVLDRVTQEEAYEAIGEPLIDYVIGGYNGTIFVYGQTSSGKTYTMEGELQYIELFGVIPRILGDIFNRIQAMRTTFEVRLKVSYMELYMEKVKDLLNPSKKNLVICEDSKKRTFVKGLTERCVNSYGDILDALEQGQMNKHTSPTSMNRRSSRSHCIFTVIIEQRCVPLNETVTSRLSLVDLAGSEKVSQTRTMGNTLNEAKDINRSLSTLANVINALVDGSRHVPYRNSKLTRILQPSLGGNAKTIIVICVSPSEANESETKSTLHFGMRAKRLKNEVKRNFATKTNQWKRLYDKEHESVSLLKSVVGRLESEVGRWRRGEIVPGCEWFKPEKYISASNFSINSSASNFCGRVQDEMSRELKEKEAQISRLQEENSRLQSMIADLRLNEIKKSASKSQDDCGVLKNELDLKQRQLRDLSKVMEDFALRLEAKSRQMGELMEEVNGLRATLKQYHNRDELEVVKLKKDVTKELHDIASKLYRVGKVWVPSIPDRCLEYSEDVLEDQLAYMRFTLKCLGDTGTTVEVKPSNDSKTMPQQNVKKVSFCDPETDQYAVRGEEKEPINRMGDCTTEHPRFVEDLRTIFQVISKKSKVKEAWVS
uniref:Kinesin-like protein n=1 Tax=Echinococcus granulosus TaxID=6210 RepID=A0A068WTI5_ECHGR|nr:kinesin 1 heavy chain [Echinococcus granulosus]